jgi:DNA-binding transcriptional ArsR family regulator
MFNQLVEHDPIPPRTPEARRGETPNLDATYAALAYGVRREILARLRSRDMRVTELAAHFNMSLSAASKHVRQLERARLVSRRTAGRDHWISLDAKRLEEAADWLELYRSFWLRKDDSGT